MSRVEGNSKQQTTTRNNCAVEDCHDDLAQKEKQIGRILLMAEKDKREAMFSLDTIKKLKDQLYALSHDFHFDIGPDEATFDFVLPPMLVLDRRRSSLPGTIHANSNGAESSGTRPSNQLFSHNQSTTNIQAPNNQPIPNPPHSNPSYVHSNSPNSSPSYSNMLASSPSLSTPSSNSSNMMHTANHLHTGEQQEVRGGGVGAIVVASGGIGFHQKLAIKEEELLRVASRAQQEAAKATFLRRKKEELQQRILTELNKRRNFIKETRQNIEHKEKEIMRLSFLAEQDKKTGMFLCQQIACLKKSLEGFLQACEESKPETLCNILARCMSSNDLFGSPPASPVRSISSSRLSTLKYTVIGKETDAVLHEDEKKSEELARVKQIVAQESRCVDALKAKVEELKQGLVTELQQADEELGLKMQEFRQKQLAIEKVAARAERERARSYFLKEEIVKLTSALGVETGKDFMMKRKGKNEEYGPDIAYLSSFSELPELEKATATHQQHPITLASTYKTEGGQTIDAEGATVTNHPPSPTEECTVAPIAGCDISSSGDDSDSQHATTLPLSIVNLRGGDDPTLYISSPPCRTIPISPASECMYVQKLKDIAVLKRETSKKEEELVRLKKLAEAERCRHLLLKDKFEQLRTEMREREAYGACTF
eukprot:Phypoly_transcript_04809.p1 GENE.Phypoly_transcript_04809~~Phypoly_transcript_04809.p1  ORF type:complete len:655 (+),score=106.47 Phypoly_transcript_04809:57-2021(+)